MNLRNDLDPDLVVAVVLLIAAGALVLWLIP